MTENTTAPAKSSSWLAILALILVILALVGIGLLGWKGFEFTQQVTQLEQSLNQAAQQRSKDKAELANMVKANEGLSLQLQHNSERLAELPGAERHDWMLAEAEYLLRLANQRLNLEKDASGAEAMLQAADDVLKETGNPLLDQVRQVIAKELIALRAVPAVDLTGAIARIQALQGQIDQLEWMPRSIEENTIKEDIEAEEPTWWQRLVEKTWTGLSSVVRIRNHNEPLVAPLSPDQHYYLQQNMHLMLEQAQVALARQNQSLYSQSIERTQTWLQQFVMMKNPSTNAAIATLEELKAWNVAPEFPNISNSLEALRALVEKQKRSSAVAFVPAAK